MIQGREIVEHVKMRKYLFNPRVLIIFSIIFYLISLFLPAIYIKIPSYESPEYWQPKEAYTGFMILMIGWFSLLSGLPAWLANISYFITLIFYDGHKPPIKSAYLTLLLALTSFFI